VNQTLAPGETGITDRGYQCHKAFDLWQQEERLFMCQIKANTKKIVIESHPVASDSMVFYDAVVLLGTPLRQSIRRKNRFVWLDMKSTLCNIGLPRTGTTFLLNRWRQHISSGGISKSSSPGGNGI